MIDEAQLEQRVGERTGLKSREEILAYICFSECAGCNDRIIMFGDVQHKFYEGLLEEANSQTRKAEEQFNDDLGKHRVKRPSPLSLIAKERYEHFLRMFIDKKLISEPQLFGKDTTKYSRLMAYNYFNDPEIYLINSGRHCRVEV